MNNKYNVLVTYEGDGDFRFKVKRVGEIIISKFKPIYIQNADVEIINDLRQLKRLLISLHIGASSEGAYKTYNVDEPTTLERIQSKNVAAVQKASLSNNEINSILSSGNNGPIVEEVVEAEPEVTEEVVQAVAEAIVEEANEEDKTVEDVVTEIVEEAKEDEAVEEPKKETKSKSKSTKKKKKR